MTLATDAAELAIQVDGVLLTVAAGRTKRDDSQPMPKSCWKRSAPGWMGAALVNVAADAELRRYLATA